MSKWLQDILTDDTGTNFTPDKVAMAGAMAMGLFGILSLIGIQIAAVAKGQEFHPDAFGAGLAAAVTGVGALIAGGGAGMWLASRQKPTPPGNP